MERTICIRVEADVKQIMNCREVVQELDKAYNKLRKKAKVKGFRPGKVPRSVVIEGS